MTTLTRFFYILLGITILTGITSAVETTPVYPGMGGAPAEHLTNMYPTVKNNTAIMGYIGECCVGSWHEEQMDAEFKSVHLTPENTCGKQLVFLARKSAGRDDPTRITDIWILGVNETWSSSMDTVFSADRALRNHDRSTGARKAPGFIVSGTLLAIALGTVLAAVMRRNL